MAKVPIIGKPGALFQGCQNARHLYISSNIGIGPACRWCIPLAEEKSSFNT